MIIDGVDFPESLLANLSSKKLVVFAGAGVSMAEPANLPDFATLANYIAEGTGQQPKNNESLDQFMGRLKISGVDVHARAVERLSKSEPQPTDQHQSLLRLFGTGEDVRIVTSNFDLLFEEAAKRISIAAPEVYSAPALPLGREFHGVVHIHGALGMPGSLVLTDGDFGRAYLTDGHTLRFLVELFRSFDVLFVGYSHDDVVMNYLSRALPRQESPRRFALTEDSDDSRWELLGIKAIHFPNQTEDYSTLRSSVARLAEQSSRGAFEWRERIRRIASEPSTLLSQEEADEVSYALSDPTRTRFFVEAATDAGWIRWLDDRGHLASLFQDQDLSEGDGYLARWLAKTFARDHAEELLGLIGKHGTHIGATLWYALVGALSMAGEKEPKGDELRMWVSLLIQTVPDEGRQGMACPYFRMLAESCSKRSLDDSVVDIFDALSEGRLKKSPYSGIAGALMRPEILGDHIHLNDIWEKFLRPKLDLIAEKLLPQLYDRLDRRNSEMSTWQPSGGGLDTDSLLRAAIETSDMNSRKDSVDVLIDAARDSLVYLARRASFEATPWFDLFIRSKAPLLRRVAVHALPMHQGMTADEKAEWLLDHVGMYSLADKYESKTAMRAIYPNTSSETRKKIIDVLLAYRADWADAKEADMATASEQLRWLRILTDADPGCELARGALGHVREAYPNVAIPEGPDVLFHTVTGMVDESDSPYSPAELLSRLGEKWVDDLLSLYAQPGGMMVRGGLEYAINLAAAQRPDWSIELAEALSKRGAWQTKLWDPLLNSWSAELPEPNIYRVLEIIDEPELLKSRQRNIAQLLLGLVRSGGKPYMSRVLPKANAVAEKLGSHVGDMEVELSTDYLTTAINSPAGMLAEFWLHSLSVWLSTQEPRPTVLQGKYGERLGLIAADDSASGRMGRAVLCRDLPFLYAVDREWAIENLAPLLGGKARTEEARAAWQGFLYSNRYNLELVQLLEESFHGAARRMSSIFAEIDPPQHGVQSQGLRNKFIHLYAEVMAQFAERAIEDWIPPLFEGFSTVEDRLEFVGRLGLVLHRLEQPQHRMHLWDRLLKPFWLGRLDGVPAPAPDRAEWGEMAEWLPHIGESFPEGVALAIRKQWGWHEAKTLAHRMERDPIWREHPAESARLLIHIGQAPHDPSRYDWQFMKPLIDELLASRDVSDHD